jgi:hypothetical protein
MALMEIVTSRFKPSPKSVTGSPGESSIGFGHVTISINAILALTPTRLNFFGLPSMSILR